MSYAVSAYLVTFLAMGLYAIYLDHERSLQRRLVDGAPPSPIPEGNFGFNFGAALTAPLWLILHGRLALGGGLLLANFGLRFGLGPRGTTELLVELAISLALFIYFGINGNRIAVQQRSHTSLEQLREQQFPWLMLGISLTAVSYYLVAMMVLL